jgi:hypothetical protein
VVKEGKDEPVTEKEERELRLNLEDERDAGEIGVEDTYSEDGNE